MSWNTIAKTLFEKRREAYLCSIVPALFASNGYSDVRFIDIIGSAIILVLMLLLFGVNIKDKHC